MALLSGVWGPDRSGDCRSLAIGLATAALISLPVAVSAQSARPSQRPVDGEKRVALVIGNEKYASAPLRNPVNDSNAIAQALRAYGFEVIQRNDADHRQMVTAIREFGSKLREGTTGLFFFAGHGMQIKGRNYLIPVGGDIRYEDEVAYAAIDAQAILDKMDAAANGSNIVILDACRNNPFGRGFRSAQAGLAQMDAPVGTLVAFSTAPGSVAADGTGPNSVYTRHLVDAMATPGLKVEDVFKRVRTAVRTESRGQQVPWESTSFEGEFYFVRGPLAAAQKTAIALPAGPPPAPRADEAALEDAFWQAVRDSKDPAEINAYLRRYPQGRYAAEARNAIERIASAAAPAKLASVAAPKSEPKVDAKPPPPPIAAVAPVSPAMKTELPKDTGQARYAVGDLWRYQVVDKWKKEVTRHEVNKITAIRDSGDLEINGGRVLYDGLMRLKYWKTVGDGNKILRESEYTPARPLWPDELSVGKRWPTTWKVRYRNPDGAYGISEFEGDAAVTAKETATVPAGTFEVFRVEASGTYINVRESSGQRFRGRWKQVMQIAPAVKRWVTLDYEEASGSNMHVQERYELTSHEPGRK